MSEQPDRDEKDPAPLAHADAERATEEQSKQVPSAQDAESIAEDPAANPPDGPLKDVKGG